MKQVLIAGGTGLIGKALCDRLVNLGFDVRILTRNPRAANHVYWNPAKDEIDYQSVKDVEVLVNLSGEALDQKRWTNQRKKALQQSRIGTTNFLFKHIDKFPNLKHYVSASGITAYGFDDGEREHPESDPYGTDFLSQLVKDWELAADQFKSKALVTKLRIAVVFSKKGGALKKIATPIKFGVGSPLGSGKQAMPWVHIDDLVEQFSEIILNGWEGAYNSNTSNHTNKEITAAIAKILKRPLLLPNVPSFLLKILFGQLSEMILNGAAADNSKIKSKGYQPKYDTLEKALKDCL